MNTSIKTNFTSGQISKNLFGRGDLSVYENGAKTLDNVIISPAGGVSRRYGTKFVDKLDKKCKLLPFSFNTEQEYLFCFYDYGLKVYKNDICIKTLEAPWNEKQIFEFDYVQSADVMTIVHPEFHPKQIIRSADEDWVIDNMHWHVMDNNVVGIPFNNFYKFKEVVWIESVSGGNCVVRSSNGIFDESYLDLYLVIHKGQFKVLQVVNSTTLNCRIVTSSTSVAHTRVWYEQSISDKRGWPCAVAFYQDRMVLGGSPSLPSHLWMSRSSDIYNFDIGSGLDDQGINFGIFSDQINPIKHIISSRDLMVFTTGSEWIVTGMPLTSSSIQVKRQTSIGSYSDKKIAPQQVDGATIFVSQNGKQLREFLYTDIEDIYQATDLTIMANDMLEKPIDADFSKDTNVLYIVLEDGTISCLTSYRTEQVKAWSKLRIDGKYTSVCVLGDDIYFGVERHGQYFVEHMDKNFFIDCGIKLTSETAQKSWSGLNDFEGQEVVVIADNFFASKQKVINGTVELVNEASEIKVGYSYEHVIEPLPYVISTSAPCPPKAYRVISSIFRLSEASSLNVTLGNKKFEIPLKRIGDDNVIDSPPINFSGDVKLRSLGWIRDTIQPMWSIRSSEPASFGLLSVTNEIKTKDS